MNSDKKNSMKVVQRIAFKVDPTFEAYLIVNHQTVFQGLWAKGRRKKISKIKGDVSSLILDFVWRHQDVGHEIPADFWILVDL